MDPAILLRLPVNRAIHLVPLLERIFATIRNHGLIPQGARVLAAVSGGADSVALALLLARLAPDHNFTLAGLAHFHHGFRGADADADQAFVAALASRLGVPCLTGRDDVAARAKDAGESFETAARRLRYAFLEEAATALGATRIATGHTADDQAETMVMRMMRGAGLHGLSGIRPRNGRIIRPLLDVHRSAIEGFLTEAGERWREDATNADVAFARNRVRHDVMPMLKSAAGDGVVDALARSASLIQDDAEELDRQAIEMARSVVLSDGRLDVAALARVSPAIGRRIVRAAIERAAGGRFVSLEQVDRVRSLIRVDVPQVVQLPGVTVARDADGLRIEPSRRAAASQPFEARLEVPGAVEVPGAGLLMSAELGTVPAGDLTALRARGDAVAVQGVGAAPLTVRSRRPGDALRPLGGPGRRKLQDVFVDRKLARAERDRVPLVVDESGRIIWVVGHTIADEFRVTSAQACVLLLKVRRVGGSV